MPQGSVLGPLIVRDGQGRAEWSGRCKAGESEGIQAGEMIEYVVNMERTNVRTVDICS